MYISRTFNVLQVLFIRQGSRISVRDVSKVVPDSSYFNSRSTGATLGKSELIQQ